MKHGLIIKKSIKKNIKLKYIIIIFIPTRNMKMNFLWKSNPTNY